MEKYIKPEIEVIQLNPESSMLLELSNNYPELFYDDVEYYD